MRIYRQGIGSFDAMYQIAMFVRKNCCRAVGSVHMEPEIIMPADVGNRNQIIYRARIRCTGSRDHAKWLSASGEIGGYRLLQFIWVELGARVHSNSPQCFATDSQ